MIVEVDAAVAHIASLIGARSTEVRQDVSSSALDIFTTSLRRELRSRCEACWYPDESERGSASRAVIWQLHAGGEGGDAAILRACASVLEADAEEGEVVNSRLDKAASLASAWFSTPFSLWIDPECVAIRMGAGPGASRSQFDTDSRASCSSAITIVWGKLLAQQGDGAKPAVTITANLTPAEHRPIPIVRPESRYPSTFANSKAQHARNASASSCGSSIAGLSRSASSSSHGSFSTDATSYCSSSEEESDACPSLVSPCSSSTSGRCASDDETEQGVASLSRTAFRGASLLFGDDVDDGEDVGDCTIHAEDAGDCTFVLEQGAEIVATPRNRKQATGNAEHPQRLQHMRTESEVSCTEDGSVKSNYTVHDNGNVGVLGGGVRLGGARPVATGQPAAVRARHHVSSKSVSNIFNPSNAIREHKKHDPFFSTMGTYTAPSHSIPLPPLPVPASYGQPPAYGGHHHQQHHHQHQHQYGATFHQGFPRPMVPRGPLYLGQVGAYGNGPLPAMPAMPSSYAPFAGYESRPGQPMEGSMRPKHGYPHGMSVSFAPSTLGYDHGDGDEFGASHGRGSESGRRRVRSRGRRSRGRGAGRAARRQAAALKALQEAGVELEEAMGGGGDGDGGLGLDVDGESSEAGYSRCSTPTASASEYTSSSCYSSAASSPARSVVGGKGSNVAPHAWNATSLDLDMEMAALRLGGAVGV